MKIRWQKKKPQGQWRGGQQVAATARGTEVRVGQMVGVEGHSYPTRMDTASLTSCSSPPGRRSGRKINGFPRYP